MPIPILVLLEVLIVIALSRLVGLAFRAIKQPQVIGEIVAGIMLGPSLLGLIAPDLGAALFPAEAVPFLNVLSEVGLIFFMFLIGLELNPKYLKNNLDVAILTSHVSILVPFSLGSFLALLLYPIVSNNSVSFTAFAMFLGAAMSITAFPVLARIITEHNLQNTKLGTLALTCAAVDDVTAWCLLAVAIAVTRTNSMVGALPTIFESIVYIGFMLTVVRWFLQRLSKHYNRTGKLSQLVLSGIYMGVVASALITEWIGIHLIFGAFLLGAAMPKNAGLTRELAEKTEDFVLIFLLPIFFAYSGLRTQIGLLNSPELWLLCAAVLGVAIIGKYFGTYVAARVCGISNREASALGWMMNTRGLTELIVLNIGLSLGVVSPLLFTMLVIMALVTTFMTSPLLEWTYPKKLIRLDISEVSLEDDSELKDSPMGGESEEINRELLPKYRILVPVANPSTQKGLLQLAIALAQPAADTGGSDLQSAAVHPLSLIELNENYGFESTPVEADRIIQERRSKLSELIESLELPDAKKFVHPIIRVTKDVARETAQIAELDRADLILVGWHRPTFSSNRLGGRVGQILSNATVDVAIFVDRGRERLNNLLVPYAANIHDDLGLELALRLLVNSEERRLTVLRVAVDGAEGNELSYEFQRVMDRLPVEVRSRIETPIVEAAEPIQAVVAASANADLTIAGTSREWGIERQTLGRYTDELAVQCHSSLLIARCYVKVRSHLASVLVDS
ncbi:MULTISPECIES: cation:proton antiporter [unclassified Microcoleus]|uniref:cation:proton antiporter n=1 Tax=unclassified Microcoleus TaxID=2642155 RepID=UPI001DCFC46C|nr:MULTISPECIES: cation:proton antiporter [unclassified Microcoleus]TAE51854.1 MAG: sodium:proton antiporter [Oscillatoriales cyanobacterium]MCC3456293.1 cation:proton antiporter [Microcoleus sp. PH2017_08_TRC_O_A]MCC3474950.1 cation:proton antiporter [Microcoleus sp. PH2017_13_LAR_U_A]MCC3487439.1 cation:proton antiporter [Microcoleus sp. PH2017_14_LAR_D_A]MCC3568444.1 cation:proton antiporter [Microcoleus sp. PH2017_31_RDM_U_A]